MTNPQDILADFEVASGDSARQRREDMGTRSPDMIAWLHRRLTAEADHAARVLAAASYALAQLPVPR